MLRHALLMCLNLALATSAGCGNGACANYPQCSRRSDFYSGNTGCTEKYTTQCKTTSTSGYEYNKFFPLPTNRDTSNFVLTFKVKTSTDAHVLLSTTPFPSGSDPVVEIVIGGWGNSQSVMRPSKQGTPIYGGEKQTRGIVSANEMRGFWVTKYRDNQLAVGPEGSSQPTLQGTDPHSQNYKYYSFASWGDGFGSWQYDCVDSYTEVCTTSD